MVVTVAVPREVLSQENDVDPMVLGNRPLVEVAHSNYISDSAISSCTANCLSLLYTVWYTSLLRRDGGNRSIDVTQNLAEHFHLFDSLPDTYLGQPSMRTTC